VVRGKEDVGAVEPRREEDIVCKIASAERELQKSEMKKSSANRGNAARGVSA